MIMIIINIHVAAMSNLKHVEVMLCIWIKSSATFACWWQHPAVYASVSREAEDAFRINTVSISQSPDREPFRRSQLGKSQPWHPAPAKDPNGPSFGRKLGHKHLHLVAHGTEVVFYLLSSWE